MSKLTKLLSIFVIVGAVGAGTAFTSGCGHKHSFTDSWSYNETSHWHDCVDKDAKSGEAPHSDDNKDGKCDTCGYALNTPSTGVTLNETEKRILTGDTFKLTATLHPSDTSYTSLEWSTDDPVVAEVDANGNVTAKAIGTAIVTVNVDNKFTASCKITVVATLDEYEVSFDLNGHGSNAPAKQNTLNGKVTAPEDPTDGTYDFVGWFDNKEGEGFAIDFATKIFDKNTTVYAYWVQNFVRVTGIELSESKKSLKAGEKFSLTATVLPENATNKSIKWETNNPAVATVSDDGSVTAVGMGTASITVTAFNGGYYKICEVTVEPDDSPVTDVTLNRTEARIAVGDTLTLTATVNPSYATDKSVSWKSDKTYVATVDNNGKVTAVSSGTAVITVTTQDGNHTATCMVTVVAPVAKMTEAEFRAAVTETRNSTNFTAYMGDDEVKVDGAKNVITVGKKYTVFDPKTKTAITYTATESNGYTKRTQNCESFADCMQIVLGLGSQLNEALGFIDYDTQVTYDNVNDEYHIGEYILAFEGGKVKILSIQGDSPDWEFISYGTANVTIPDFGNAEEEKKLDEVRRETQAKLDEIYNGLLATHTRNSAEITKFYNEAKASIAACKDFEELEAAFIGFTVNASFDSDAAIQAAIDEIAGKIKTIKDANSGNYTKEVNKPKFEALFKNAETVFANATSVQIVNDYYNNYFEKDEETGISRFETDLAAIPTDEEVGSEEESPELTDAKTVAKAVLRESWKEYLAANESVNGLLDEYKNNAKAVWETAKQAVENAKTPEAVNDAIKRFNFDRNKEEKKSAVVEYAKQKTATLDEVNDAELILSVNAKATEYVKAIDALNVEENKNSEVDRILTDARQAIDALLAN